MRGLPWGRRLHVIAKLNDKHEIPTTIMNVGYGPSFLVPKHALDGAGLALNSCVSVSLRVI